MTYLPPAVRGMLPFVVAKSRHEGVAMKKPVLIVLTSHATKGSTGEATGAYLSELTHPHAAFAAAGYDVAFASVRGGKVPLDGVDRDDPVNAKFLDDGALVDALHTSRPVAEVDASQYAAVFFAGGHGTMWDFRSNAVSELAGKVHDAGGVVGAVCHGPAALVDAKTADGKPLVAGRAVTGFTNDEERAVGLEAVVPFSLEDALVASGGTFRPGGLWKKNVVVADRLVTGQNPASAEGVAREMITLLGGG